MKDYEGLSKDDARAAWGAVFREIPPGAGFKTGDFVKESWGGYYRRTTHPSEGKWFTSTVVGRAYSTSNTTEIKNTSPKTLISTKLKVLRDEKKAWPRRYTTEHIAAGGKERNFDELKDLVIPKKKNLMVS